METVNAIVCGVELRNLRVMNSRYAGFDCHHKRKFQQGQQIAYLSSQDVQRQCTKEQLDKLFPNGKMYHVSVIWPLDGNASVKEKTAEKKKDGSFTPSKYQKRIKSELFDNTANILIEALAGSGKTSTLVWLIHELAKAKKITNKKIVYLAFNKSIQEELSEKLTGTGVSALTTHAVGFNIIKKKFGRNISPTNGRIASNAFTRLVCDDNGYPYNKEAFKEARKTEEYVLQTSVLELVGYIKNWGIFPEYFDGLWEFSIESKEKIAEFIDMYEIEINENFEPKDVVNYACRLICNTLPDDKSNVSEIDFDDMLYLPLCLNLAAPKYDLVFTDESQDFNNCQILLLEKLTRGGGRAVVVGDPNQSLYRFRGADSNAFNRIEEMLKASGEVVKCQLPINYRCDSSIIEHAKSWVPGLLGNRKEKGVVEDITFGEAIGRANNDGEDIVLADALPNRSGFYSRSLKGSDVTFAFLCRVNLPLVITAYQLISQGKRVCIIGRTQIGQPLKNIIYSLCGTNPQQRDYTDRITDKIENGEIVEEGLMSRLANYIQLQSNKLKDQKHEGKLEALQQNVECIEVIATRVQNDSVASVIEEIDSLFTEEPEPGVISLSTIHRAKGLEFSVVFILRPDLLPHPRANSDEEIQQEVNAQYVAATRAKNRLFYVSNWPFNGQNKTLSYERN